MSDDLIASRLREWNENLLEYDKGGIESYLMVKDARQLVAGLADALAAERALADAEVDYSDVVLPIPPPPSARITYVPKAQLDAAEAAVAARDALLDQALEPHAQGVWWRGTWHADACRACTDQYAKEPYPCPLRSAVTELRGGGNG